MNDAVMVPENDDQLQEILSAGGRMQAIGHRTKPALSESADTRLVSLRSLSGILQYTPSEFTFTARAGTTINEINAVLKEKGQYLPFDPMLVEAGATIGGTVAAGMSGPGRQRYGGIRDFFLGVKFISGDGNTISAGGKVVKNAAGFDLPKFMIGSMGCFGVMTELTFKVFPQPQTTKTLGIQCPTHQEAMQRIGVAACSRWEADAIDYRPGDQKVYVRLAGPGQACNAIAAEIHSTWGADVTAVDGGDSFWHGVRELSWSSGHPIAVKVPITPARFIELCRLLGGQPMHLSAAGNVLWILLADQASVATLSRHLEDLGIAGLVVRGSQPRLGQWPTSQMLSAVKDAMDPLQKFPQYP